jgi:uncharacterized protein (DUF342 family)
MDQGFKRVTDPAVEAKGFILYADEEWMEVRVDLLNNATSDGLYELLSSRGIVQGVDDVRVAQIFEAHGDKGELLQETIARGNKARPGRDGSFEWQVEMGENKIEVTDAEGNVDFRDLNLIKEINSGSPVLKVLPPDMGDDGLNVLGKVLPVPKVKKAKLRLGKNVRLDEKSMVVYAVADGHVEFLDPLVSVQETFEVSKDVDFTIGNLSFIGSLSFEGEIPTGYTMEAGKDIRVRGKVTGSNLKANGDIICESGITGSDSTQIVCEGVLKAKFINEASVFSKGGVECYVEMVRSKVRTRGMLKMDMGAIRGSEVYCFEGIVVKEMGSPSGIPTFIAVGLDYSVDERIDKLNDASQKLEEHKAKLKEAIAPFMKNKLLLIKAPESKKTAVKTVLNNIEAIDGKLKKVEEMIAGEESSRYDRTKRIEVNGTIADDVTIQVGNKKKKFDRAGKRKGFIMYDRTSFEIVFSKS